MALENITTQNPEAEPFFFKVVKKAYSGQKPGVQQSHQRKLNHTNLFKIMHTI